MVRIRTVPGLYTDRSQPTSLGMLGSYAPTRAAARSFHSLGLAHRYRRNRWPEMCVNVTRTPPFRNPSSLKCQVGPDTALS